jgi:hypothetical protein
MEILSFKRLFFDFYQINRSRREKEIQGKSGLDLSGWSETLFSLVNCYRLQSERQVLIEALSDPYFPFTKLKKLNLQEFRREPGFRDLTEERLAKMAAQHLLQWAKIFLSIRLALKRINKGGRVSSLSLKGSPGETIPQTGSCNHCGRCCEIRGGPAEFTGSVEPPDEWLAYFRGDCTGFQRFCPFLFEYFAMGKFFCSIYLIKPKCCWEFDQEECDFLQKDVARERMEGLRAGLTSRIK